MHWDDFARDLRYTFRTLRRDKSFCAPAVLIIALGIGANTTMFSVVNGLLFRPLPFRGSGRLVWIANTGSGPGLSSVTSRVSTFVEWQTANRIALNGGPASVVGVLPTDFDFAAVFVPGSRVDMIVPFPLTQANDRLGNRAALRVVKNWPSAPLLEPAGRA